MRDGWKGSHAREELARHFFSLDRPSELVVIHWEQIREDRKEDYRAQADKCASVLIDGLGDSFSSMLVDAILDQRISASMRVEEDFLRVQIADGPSDLAAQVGLKRRYDMIEELLDVTLRELTPKQQEGLRAGVLIDPQGQTLPEETELHVVQLVPMTWSGEATGDGDPDISYTDGYDDCMEAQVFPEWIEFGELAYRIPFDMTVEHTG